jgi:hypothetical protein
LIPLTLIFLRSLQVKNYLKELEKEDWLSLSDFVNHRADLTLFAYGKVVS